MSLSLVTSNTGIGGVFSENSNYLDPEVTIGSPFIREGIKRHTISIRVGSESIQIEASLTQEKITSPNLARELLVVKLEDLVQKGLLQESFQGSQPDLARVRAACKGAVLINAFHQRIICRPVLKQDVIPNTIADLKTRFLEIIPGFKELNLDFIEIPNEDFLVAQACIESSKSEVTTNRNGDETTGCFLTLYQTKQALYILGDKSYEKNPNFCSKTSASSLKLIKET